MDKMHSMMESGNQDGIEERIAGINGVSNQQVATYLHEVVNALCFMP